MAPLLSIIYYCCIICLKRHIKVDQMGSDADFLDDLFATL